MIGLSLGTFGAGGAILMLPVLVHIAHYPPPQAVPMSMAVMSVTSLAGAAGYLRRGDVSLRLALVFGLGGIAGAFTGSSFTHFVSPWVLMLIFSGVLATVGLTMLFRGEEFVCATACLPPRCFLIALGIGLLTGFLGVGGGFLMVPALMRFGGLGPRQAAGTSLALIGINSLTGLAGQLRYVNIDWRAAGLLALAALAGIAIGFRFSDRIPQERLRPALAILLLLVAVLNLILLFS